MAFMQVQQTGRESWLRVETMQGITFLRLCELSLFVRNSETTTQPLTDKEHDKYASRITPYVDGIPTENVKGYGVRLSAPGYLDCTEWDVYDSEEEATTAADELREDEDGGEECD
jgi:hypothetical protein